MKISPILLLTLLPFTAQGQQIDLEKLEEQLLTAEKVSLTDEELEAVRTAWVQQCPWWAKMPTGCGEIYASKSRSARAITIPGLDITDHKAVGKRCFTMAHLISSQGNFDEKSINQDTASMISGMIADKVVEAEVKDGKILIKADVYEAAEKAGCFAKQIEATVQFLAETIEEVRDVIVDKLKLEGVEEFTAKKASKNRQARSVEENEEPEEEIDQEEQPSNEDEEREPLDQEEESEDASEGDPEVTNDDGEEGQKSINAEITEESDESDDGQPETNTALPKETVVQEDVIEEIESVDDEGAAKEL